MKKLLFIGILFLLIGCNSPTFTPDPSLKESERIAVLEKAKTDTTTIVVKVDERLYIIEKGVIKGRTWEEQPTSFSMLIGGIIFGIVLVGFIALLVHSD